MCVFWDGILIRPPCVPSHHSLCRSAAGGLEAAGGGVPPAGGGRGKRFHEGVRQRGIHEAVRHRLRPWPPWDPVRSTRRPMLYLTPPQCLPW